MERSTHLHPRAMADAPLPLHHTALLLARAAALRHSARDGRVQPLLQGRRIALVCEADGGVDAQRFRRAAGELGAQVSHVRAALGAHTPPAEVERTARLLGRLYDAIECQGVPGEVVQRIADVAGVPVYDGLASPAHPTARLAELLEVDASAADKRHLVVQAALLDAVR